jgi:hypothetical protein
MAKKDIGDQGGNAPRGDPSDAVGPGEGGGPAGVQRSGGKAMNREREGTGAPPGTTPTDLQESPEELVEAWKDDWR